MNTFRTAGSGPRHMEFNADFTVLYCLAELTGEVLVYDINHNGEVPAFSLKQRIQADETNARGSADIHIHPTGKWLYTSHRLSNDGIAIFFPTVHWKRWDMQEQAAIRETL